MFLGLERESIEPAYFSGPIEGWNGVYDPLPLRGLSHTCPREFAGWGRASGKRDEMCLRGFGLRSSMFSGTCFIDLVRPGWKERGGYFHGMCGLGFLELVFERGLCDVGRMCLWDEGFVFVGMDDLSLGLLMGQVWGHVLLI